MELPDEFSPIAGVAYELAGKPVLVLDVQPHPNPDWKNIQSVTFQIGTDRIETLTAGRVGYDHYWKPELLRRLGSGG